MTEKKLVIKEKRPYKDWEERSKADTKRIIKQKLEDNDLTYAELTKKGKELEEEYETLKLRIEEVESEAIQIEYLRMLLLLLEMVE